MYLHQLCESVCWDICTVHTFWKKIMSKYHHSKMYRYFPKNTLCEISPSFQPPILHSGRLVVFLFTWTTKKPTFIPLALCRSNSLEIGSSLSLTVFLALLPFLANYQKLCKYKKERALLPIHYSRPKHPPLLCTSSHDNRNIKFNKHKFETKSKLPVSVSLSVKFTNF